MASLTKLKIICFANRRWVLNKTWFCSAAIASWATDSFCNLPLSALFVNFQGYGPL